MVAYVLLWLLYYIELIFQLFCPHMWDIIEIFSEMC